MIMENFFDMVYTETRHHQPLVVVRNFPGLDAEFTPAQLRAMGKALLLAADESEARSPRDSKRKLTQKQNRRFMLTETGQGE